MRHAQEFEPGDVVSLKSGSTPMTVKTACAGKVCCVWFDGDQFRETNALAAALLELAPEPDAGDRPPW